MGALDARVKAPDLLATKRGRLAAFFLLYLTEGIPLGFTATAIATQMRRQGLGAGRDRRVRRLALPAVGVQVGVGPFVDMLSLGSLRPAAHVDRDRADRA